MALQAAVDGLGVAVGLRPYVEHDIAAGRLVAPFTLAVPKGRAWYLVYRPFRHDDPGLVAFGGWLRESFQSGGEGAARLSKTLLNARRTVMRLGSLASRASSLGVAILLVVGAADAAEIKVMISGGFSAAYHDLIAEFERATGHKLTTSAGASMGGAPDSIPSRLARGEGADVLILAGSAVDNLIKDGKAQAGSRVDLARSLIGMVVRKGAPKPDISTVDALKRTLLDAKSIAYSASASGVYLSTEMFARLGIADEIKHKAKRIESERVAAVVARGDAEIGFQQVSELLPEKGTDYVGPLPPEVQRVTVFSAGIASGSKEPEAGRALIKFLVSPAASAAVTKSGLEPMTSASR
jgi:molybdate transport system substrate-binding protein